MLILTRHKNQRITVRLPNGGVITITVVETSSQRGKTRIGIDAPRDCRIWREEIDPDRPDPEDR